MEWMIKYLKSYWYYTKEAQRFSSCANISSRFKSEWVSSPWRSSSGQHYDTGSLLYSALITAVAESQWDLDKVNWVWVLSTHCIFSPLLSGCGCWLLPWTFSDIRNYLLGGFSLHLCVWSNGEIPSGCFWNTCPWGLRRANTSAICLTRLYKS